VLRKKAWRDPQVQEWLKSRSKELWSAKRSQGTWTRELAEHFGPDARQRQQELALTEAEQTVLSQGGAGDQPLDAIAWLHWLAGQIQQLRTLMATATGESRSVLDGLLTKALKARSWRTTRIAGLRKDRGPKRGKPQLTEITTIITSLALVFKALIAQGRPKWRVTALSRQLNCIVPKGTRDLKNWPGNPRALSRFLGRFDPDPEHRGRALRRIFLRTGEGSRRNGVVVTFGRVQGKTAKKRRLRAAPMQEIVDRPGGGDPPLVKLRCGHEVHSGGMKRAHCEECTPSPAERRRDPRTGAQGHRIITLALGDAAESGSTAAAPAIAIAKGSGRSEHNVLRHARAAAAGKVGLGAAADAARMGESKAEAGRRSAAAHEGVSFGACRVCTHILHRPPGRVHASRSESRLHQVCQATCQAHARRGSLSLLDDDALRFPSREELVLAARGYGLLLRLRMADEFKPEEQKRLRAEGGLDPQAPAKHPAILAFLALAPATWEMIFSAKAVRSGNAARERHVDLKGTILRAIQAGHIPSRDENVRHLFRLGMEPEVIESIEGIDLAQVLSLTADIPRQRPGLREVVGAVQALASEHPAGVPTDAVAGALRVHRSTAMRLIHEALTRGLVKHQTSGAPAPLARDWTNGGPTGRPHTLRLTLPGAARPTGDSRADQC
jgi:hypothetical protein